MNALELISKHGLSDNTVDMIRCIVEKHDASLVEVAGELQVKLNRMRTALHGVVFDVEQWRPDCLLATTYRDGALSTLRALIEDEK